MAMLFSTHGCTLMAVIGSAHVCSFIAVMETSVTRSANIMLGMKGKNGEYVNVRYTNERGM